jgi:hypothetical protein
MNENASNPLVHAIEVSGWDVAEDFFVEQTRREWTSGAHERVFLHRAVRPATVVFLRLIHPTDLGAAFPVAYQVEDIRKRVGSEFWELRLSQLRGRPKVEGAEVFAAEERPEEQFQ